MLVITSSSVLLAIGPATAYKVNNQPGEEALMIEVDLPESVGDWKLQSELSDDWMPVFHGAVHRKQVYQNADDKVILYVGCYRVQQQGKELINDLNRISNEDKWRTVYPRERLTQTGNYQVLEQLLEASDGEQRLVWYWYRVADRAVTNKYEAKLLQLVTSLAEKRPACVLAVATRLEVNHETAQNRLYEFALKDGPIKAGLSE